MKALFSLEGTYEPKKSSFLGLPVADQQATPLARRLNELITDTGELMEHLGCSSQAISQYKMGTSRPTLENLCKIADFYGVTTDYLLGRTETKSPDADIRAVQEYTGLSELAIEKLTYWYGKDTANPITATINALIDLLAAREL